MIESGKVYRVVDPDRCADKSVRKGERVVLAPQYDYGCAADDTRVTGVPHVSVVRASKQDGPFFTTPEGNLILADAPDSEEVVRKAPEGVRAVLTNWKVTKRPFGDFDCVHGTVIQTNGDFCIGETVFTNRIKSLTYSDEQEHGYVVTASDSLYILLKRAASNG